MKSLFSKKNVYLLKKFSKIKVKAGVKKSESDNPNHSSFRIPLLPSGSDGVLRKILEGHLTQSRL